MKNLIYSFFIFIITGCHPYGKKVEWQGKILYYPAGLGKNKANGLLTYLVEHRYFEDSITEMRLYKDNNRWVLKIPIRKGTENDEEKLLSLKIRTTFLSDSIPTPDIELTDEKFNTVKLIPNAIRELGKPYPQKPYPDDANERVTLFILPSITDEEAARLYSFLVKFDAKNSNPEDKGTGVIFQIEKDGSTYILSEEIKEGIVEDAIGVIAEQTFGVAISEKVFGGRKVDIRTMDEHFKTIRTYLYDEKYKAYIKYL